MKKLIILVVFVTLSLSFMDNRSFDYGQSANASPSGRTNNPLLQHRNDQLIGDLGRLSAQLKFSLDRQDRTKGGFLVDSILKIINNNTIVDSTHFIAPYYFIGAYYSIDGQLITSLDYFQRALVLLNKYPDIHMEGRVLYFMGYAHNRLGDYVKSVLYFGRSLDASKKEFGLNSLELIPIYISLASANIDLRDYEKAIEYSKSGLGIANIKADSVPAGDLAMLYQSIGVALLNTSDYKQANLNLLKAEEISEKNLLPKNSYYINMLDNIATSFFYLGQFDKCIEYYEKGINIAMKDNSILSLSMFSNYSVVLGEKKMAGKGVKILASALEKAKNVYSENSREYFLSLKNYADYLREYKIDIPGTKLLFIKCFEYSKSHPWDINLNRSISLGYSLSLMDNNEPEVALDTINSLLFRGVAVSKPEDPYSNPDINVIRPDKETWNILGAKYRILRKLFSRSKDVKAVESAANTSELRIAVLERIRLNIGEDESRLLLGDKYRDSYMDAIESFNLCHQLTDNPLFLEKAFEYTEKSKVANLLASTREMKAIKSHIPENIASTEKSLQQEISLYEAKVSEENNLQNRDLKRIRLWNDYLLIATQRRDSLKKVFERNYPEYYVLKYNTLVIKSKDIPNLIGRNKNYISYVISDSLLYIFIVNRKYNQLIVKNIDSLFFSTISKFRKLLSEPGLSYSILDDFSLFQQCGYTLYSYLIDPIRKYVIYGDLIISPDYTLAFFPFETLITDRRIRDDLEYKKLPYLMKDYQISYTYSATFLSESEKAQPSFSNSSMSFAPSYDSIMYVDSILAGRQSGAGVLKSLPYAIEEAAFVSKLTSGKLYQNGFATESTYKAEAGKFDIIHLAMHTLFNETDPMNSGMIFSKADNSNEDPYLSTYEIYGIPLNAKMVVLSSCFTGAGALSAGEGVLSLARGFIFAGSKSVIMSLWEVDDRSGTDIIKLFYKYLKAGDSKSKSLRKARIKYLENSDYLRSHPYFWSTLVIYGDDSPLYYNILFKMLIFLILILIIGLTIFYFKKRRYS